MIKLLKFIYIISLFYLAGCSFDQKTGIWSGNEEERKKISELERGRAIIKVEVFSSKKDFDEEINSNTGVQLTSASEINISWPMSGLNLKNSKYQKDQTPLNKNSKLRNLNLYSNQCNFVNE